MEPSPSTEICIPGKLSVVVEGFVKQSLRPWLPAWHQPHKTCTCTHAVCRDARRKMYVDFDNQKHQPCSGGLGLLLPPTVSELSQYVHSVQLSPEEHHHPDERERLWIVEFSIVRSVMTTHLRVWFKRIREWDTTLTNTQTIQCVRTQTCKWGYKKE